jgi:hypothetical protein
VKSRSAATVQLRRTDHHRPTGTAQRSLAPQDSARQSGALPPRVAQPTSARNRRPPRNSRCAPSLGASARSTRRSRNSTDNSIRFTPAYARRRTAEGKTKREILRYIAREVYNALRAALAALGHSRQNPPAQRRSSAAPAQSEPPDATLGSYRSVAGRLKRQSRARVRSVEPKRRTEAWNFTAGSFSSWASRCLRPDLSKGAVALWLCRQY